MNKIKLLNFLFLNLFFLAACSTAYSVKPFTPQITTDDQVMVYIYRPFATSNAIYSPDLYINDEFKLSIINGKVTHFTLPPGHFKFELEPDKHYSGLTRISLDLSAGSTHFIRVDTSLKIKSAPTYEPYKRSFNLTKIENQLAVKEIARCCMNNKIESKADEETKTVKKQAEEGFSVDDMQNPFSH